jgi:phosphinothricin acetyltransferase
MNNDLHGAVVVRPASDSDATAMLAIYAYYVRETSISFEHEVPSLEEFGSRVRKYIAGWGGVVAELDGEVVGYAYGSSHRERAAYRWSAETTVYVQVGKHGSGIGRRLYGALLPALANAGYCNAYAGVALPNPASVGLHRAVGFSPIGTFPRVGYKFGAWCDVAWFHMALREGPDTSQPQGAA